jgi:hypothetical protein
MNNKLLIGAAIVVAIIESVALVAVYRLNTRLSAVETQVDCNLSQRVEACVELCHEKVASYDDSTGTCTCQGKD